MVVGGPYSSGVLAGGKHFEYQPASQEILAKVDTLKTLADKHGVSLKAVALQFSLAHTVTAAVVAGATQPTRIAEDRAASTRRSPRNSGPTCAPRVWSPTRPPAARRLITRQRPHPTAHKAVRVNTRKHMASTSVSRIVPASGERVWDLIGGFHALPDWLPYISESTALQGGRVRRLTNPDGEVIVERLVNANEQERHYSYAILEAPFPVTGYLSTLRVFDIPGRPDTAEVV